MRFILNGLIYSLLFLFLVGCSTSKIQQGDEEQTKLRLVEPGMVGKARMATMLTFARSSQASEKPFGKIGDSFEGSFVRISIDQASRELRNVRGGISKRTINYIDSGTDNPKFQALKVNVRDKTYIYVTYPKDPDGALGIFVDLTGTFDDGALEHPALAVRTAIGGFCSGCDIKLTHCSTCDGTDLPKPNDLDYLDIGLVDEGLIQPLPITLLDASKFERIECETFGEK